MMTWNVGTQFNIPSVQQISSTQKGHSFSASKISHFNTSLTSTPNTPQFTPEKFKALWPFYFFGRAFWVTLFGVELRGYWSWTDGVRCWTKEVWVLKRCSSCVELRESVWNWGGLCGTEGSSQKCSKFFRWSFSTYPFKYFFKSLGPKIENTFFSGHLNKNI